MIKKRRKNMGKTNNFKRKLTALTLSLSMLGSTLVYGAPNIVEDTKQGDNSEVVTEATTAETVTSEAAITGPTTAEAVTSEEVTITTKDALKIASIHDPISNNEEQIVTYCAVYFGSYPQSEVTGEALTREIVEAKYISDDAVVLDKKYRRLQGEDGTFRYFLYEPIQWRVIHKEGNEALLRSDLIMDCEVYSDFYKEDWFFKDIRYWLNSYRKTESGFRRLAFTSTELDAINGKMYQFDNDFTYDRSYIPATRDKIFLLSAAELYELGGIRYPYELKTKASDYAFANGVKKKYLTAKTVTADAVETNYAGWWLRDNTDFPMEDLAGYVNAEGVRYELPYYSIYSEEGYYGIPQDTEGIGVCPAIVLDLEKTNLWCTQEEIDNGTKINRGVNTSILETGQCGEDVYYTLYTDGTLYITGTGKMYDYNGNAVSPFENKPNIYKVIIEEGIESVGNRMFADAWCITEVVLPESIKTIGAVAFYNCSRLKAIELPKHLVQIKDFAFEGCSFIEEIIVPNTVTEIGTGAFWDCYYLTKLQLPEGLSKISESLCQNCPNLAEISIPLSVTEIGEDAFYGTKWMERKRKKNPFVIVNGILIDMNKCKGEVEIPSEVSQIAASPIEYLDDIEKIVIPESVKKICDGSIISEKFRCKSYKFYVKEGSYAEQYLIDRKWTGYHVIKADGTIVRIGEDGNPIPTEKPIESENSMNSQQPIGSENPIQSQEPTESDKLDNNVSVQAVLLGDVNLDNQVTLNDAQNILRYALLLDEYTEIRGNLADADEDGQVTLQDAQLILRAALLLIPWEKKISINIEQIEVQRTHVLGSIRQTYALGGLLDSWEPFMVHYKDPDYWEMLPIYIPPAPAKPVIYLYPEETIEVSVNLDFNGEFTFTWPDYRDGWQVIAEPDGKLTDTVDGSEHYYLFWEGKSNVQYTFKEGFCIKGKDTVTFLKETLSKQGLTPKEYNDMITFWVPRMQENEYNVISFVEDVYTDNAKLTFSKEPDSMKRIFMVYYGSDEPVDIEEQELTGFEREGFTVVEWGGAEVSENCYIR